MPLFGIDNVFFKIDDVVKAILFYKKLDLRIMPGHQRKNVYNWVMTLIAKAETQHHVYHSKSEGE
jgi:hypothetical protein